MALSKNENNMLLDELTLTLEEFARACQRDSQWVMVRVKSELINPIRSDNTTLCFSSSALIRARRLANVETTFDINEDAAGLIVDLIEEVERLKRLVKSS